jgi:hypothetical protein
MVRTLEQLRKDAELNLCERCYRVYLAMIEPNIKVLIESRLHDWRFAENDITTMVLHHKGAFKTDAWAEASRYEEWGDLHHELMDKTIFDKTKKMRFSDKIAYLRDTERIPESCYQLFKEAGNRRNMIHESPMIYNFPEEDLNLFHLCFTISTTLIHLFRSSLPEQTQESYRKGSETAAQKWLEEHHVTM